jgi:capsular polysaccharide biosynthesis protein
MGIDRGEAILELAARAGLAQIDPGGLAIGDSIAEIGRALGRLSNPQVELHDSAAIPGLSSRLVFGRQERRLADPLHLCGRPDCFTDGSPNAESPDFRVLELPEWHVCHFPDVPLVVSPDGDLIAVDLGSRYAGLVHFYDTPLRRVLADAIHVEGTVVLLGDDVRPLNYGHWLLDWLPRLAFLGEQARRSDVFVAVPYLPAWYPWAALRLAGFPPERVIQLDMMQALRARRLLVPNDLRVPPHPGHKAAPWVLDFLRGSIGYCAFLDGIDAPARRKKLYISRGDSSGRRVLNEAAMIAALAPYGYQPVTLGGMSLAQQIAAFSCASHIVAPHGAGLANIAFADRSTTLVELFPATYGTAAYYVLAAGLGMTYASYVAAQISPGSRSQLDDFSVDIPDFLARCRHLL